MKDIKTVDEIVRDIEQIVFEISKSNRMDNPNVFNTKVNKVFDICRYYHKAKVEEYKSLIKELWKTQELLAEKGEIAIGYGFSENYDRLKIQINKLLNDL